MDHFTAQPIAIVGIAAELPGSGPDLDALDDLLDRGRDLVAAVPAARREDAGIGPDTPLAECATLASIDAFDAEFFGVSHREAREMDPQQRLLLQLSCRAVWDAGYSLEQLAGSNTATVFGAARETYSSLFAQDVNPLMTGLLPAAQAGRVAHVLGLRGPAMVVDTACSSSLAAVHEAARKLTAGEVDMALTGGVRLFPVPPPAVVPGNEGILSPGGRARSFDAAADGTGLGEGGVVFLLKTLEQARRDGDPVHAVLLGGASNQDGGRSNGFAAPSAQAQEDVLLAAWRAAGIHPNSLGFVEGHATGTKLGDPIEFEALSSAFARRTDRTNFCVLSSIKSNIGHLDSAAGAAGLLKAVLAVKTGKRYASAHFRTPNPLLDVAGSALALSAVTQPWDSPGPRRAGVSAFGITGTNVHLVLEQAPQLVPAVRPNRSTSVLLPVAARSEEAVRRHAGRLARHLRVSPPGGLADLAQVQAVCRDHELARACVAVVDDAAAVEALERIAAGAVPVERVPDAAVPVLLLPDEDAFPGEDAARAWLEAFPPLRAWHAGQREALGAGGHPGRAGDLLTKLTVVRALVEAGVPDSILVGHGSGNLVVDVLRGQTDLAAAVAGRSGAGAADGPDRTRMGAAFARLRERGELVAVAVWPGRLAELAGELVPVHGGRLLELAGASGPRDPRADLLDLVGAAYRAGVRIDWPRFTRFVGGYGARASVPTELFVPTRHWVVPAGVSPAPAAEDRVAAEAADAGWPAWVAEGDFVTDTERALAVIWAELLGTEVVEREADFFELGGDSLMQVEMDLAIERDLGLSVSLEIYGRSCLHELAAHLDSLAESPMAAAGTPRLVHEPDRTCGPASHSQRRMWLLQQLAPDSGAYNVSARFELDGPVDVTALRTALDALATRHAILRTSLALTEEGLTQHVGPDTGFALEVADASDGAEALTRLDEHAMAPFDLADHGAARALLVLPAGGDPALLQLVLHHAICDEQSMNLLLDGLAAEYAAAGGAGAGTAVPAVQYLDWAVWEHAWMAGDACAEDAGYWAKQLDGVPTELPIPTDVPHGPQQSYRGAWLDLSIPPALTAEIGRAARERQGTVFAWLMTGYAAWIARLCQVEDFLLGVPVSGRSHPDTEGMLGCFTNTLPIRVDASGNPSFGTLFDRVWGSLSGAFSHQRYPFDLLVDQRADARDASRPPLVQTLLSLQGTADRPDRRIGGTRLRPVDRSGTVSWFDISAVLWEAEDGGLAGIFAYRTELFEESTVRAFWRDWLAYLEAGVERPDVPLSDLLVDADW